MQKALEIVDLIITTVHLGSGPPLCGEDIVQEQMSSGHQLRRIYLTFGQIVAIRCHSKDTNTRCQCHSTPVLSTCLEAL